MNVIRACVSNRVKVDDLPDFVTPAEFGRVLGVNLTCVYQMIRQPGFPVVRIGRKFVIDKRTALEWFKNQEAI